MHTKTLYIAALAIITLCGCEGIVDTVIPQPEPPADTSIVGVWDVETIDGLTLEMAIPGAENLANAFDIVTFSADGGFERIWGWALGPNDEGIVVAPPVYFNISGTYTVDGQRFTVNLTETHSLIDFPDFDSGTWSRTGSQLTLTYDAGTVIVLKERG